MPTVKPTLPAWWNRELYSFLGDMPIEGWVWEFMRRARLKKVLRAYPVDAMNPEPHLETINADYINYYKNWKWFAKLSRKQLFIPQAVNIQDRWPEGFHGQQYRIDECEKKIIKITIDLSRRDSVIRHDFERVLKKLRTEHPDKTSRINPRRSVWLENAVLEIWDLRQLKVSWNSIEKILGLSDKKDYIRKSNYIAEDMIDKDKWIELAHYIGETGGDDLSIG